MAEPKDISVGVLSYGAHDTLRQSVGTHFKAGLPELAGEYFLFFNAITEADRALAEELSVPCHGEAENTGIYGGFRAIAETANCPYVLVLENDIAAIADSGDMAECLTSAVEDMATHGIPVFCLRSRTNPGQGLNGVRKFVRSYGVSQPLTSAFSPQRARLTDNLYMRLRHGTLDRFRGAAVFVEQAPERSHPRAWRKLRSGNYLTTSRFRNWSNQSVLFERQFFFDVVCRRVDAHPDPRLVNGHQDIERAMNRPWWRRLNVPMGHSAKGVFSHARIDGDPTPAK